MDVTNADIMCVPMAYDSHSNFYGLGIGHMPHHGLQHMNKGINRVPLNKIQSIKIANKLSRQAKNIATDVVQQDIKKSSADGGEVEPETKKKDILQPKKNNKMTPVYAYTIGTLLLLIGYVIIYKASKKV